MQFVPLGTVGIAVLAPQHRDASAGHERRPARRAADTLTHLAGAGERVGRSARSGGRAPMHRNQEEKKKTEASHPGGLLSFATLREVRAELQTPHQVAARMRARMRCASAS
jgi:hypothetical protein